MIHLNHASSEICLHSRDAGDRTTKLARASRLIFPDHSAPFAQNSKSRFRRLQKNWPSKGFARPIPQLRPELFEPRKNNIPCSMWNTKTRIPIHAIIISATHCQLGQPTYRPMTDIVASAYW